MEKVLLNSDLLNDCESVYFQIDQFKFIKFPTEGTDCLLSFLKKCYSSLANEGIRHKALFVPFNIYNNIRCLMSYFPIKESCTVEDALLFMGIREKDVVVYIPDRLKNMAKI